MACNPTDCTVDGCLRPARRSGLCWGHLKQRTKGKPLSDLAEKGHGPKRVLQEAIYDWVEADASDKAAWARAWDRVRKAAVRYAKAGRRPRKKPSPA